MVDIDIAYILAYVASKKLADGVLDPVWTYVKGKVTKNTGDSEKASRDVDDVEKIAKSQDPDALQSKLVELGLSNDEKLRKMLKQIKEEIDARDGVSSHGIKVGNIRADQVNIFKGDHVSISGPVKAKS